MEAEVEIRSFALKRFSLSSFEPNPEFYAVGNTRSRPVSDKDPEAGLNSEARGRRRSADGSDSNRAFFTFMLAAGRCLVDSKALARFSLGHQRIAVTGQEAGAMNDDDGVTVGRTDLPIPTREREASHGRRGAA